MDDRIMIGNKEYYIYEEELAQSDLIFYPENPRIYSMLDVANENPDQSDIEKTLIKMDHVKQLKESIKANGGVIDPLIVRDGDYVVLEGNSRLAAYRILASKNPIKWAKIRCKVLPKDIPDSAIFTLLGQYHIIGRKDWSPYEQAGYLSRTLETSKQPIEYIAEELGLTLATAKKFVEVYKFMVEKNDLHSEKWSYYEELLKNRPLKKYLETVSGLEDTIVEQIKNGEIKKATDIRNVLGGIAKVTGNTSKRIMKKIAEKEISIYDGYERIEDTGKTGNIYQILNKFHIKITEDSFKARMKNEDRKKIEFELKKIKKTIEDLLKELN